MYKVETTIYGLSSSGEWDYFAIAVDRPNYPKENKDSDDFIYEIIQECLPSLESVKSTSADVYLLEEWDATYEEFYKETEKERSELSQLKNKIIEIESFIENKRREKFDKLKLIHTFDFNGW